jgi:hypothetical protein
VKVICVANLVQRPLSRGKGSSEKLSSTELLPLGANHYFNENVQKCKTRRLEELLAEHAETTYNSKGGAQVEKVVKLQQLQQSMAIPALLFVGNLQCCNVRHSR